MPRLNNPFGRIFQETPEVERANSSVIVPSIGEAEAKTSPENLDGSKAASPAVMSRMLNIGCGYDKRPGYLNIDMDPACEPDFLVGPDNADDLPADYFQKVLAKDVLEHIPRTQTLSALLQWARYLQLGGRLELQTSSIYGVVDMMRQQESFAYHYGMTVCMFGSQAHPGDFHYTGFTEQTLRVHLLAAGFMPISVKLCDGWLFHVQAMKYEDWTTEPAEGDKIAFLSERALGRQPDPHHYSVFEHISYLEAARIVYGSSERLFYVASKFGI
jgi:hypothetical protein